VLALSEQAGLVRGTERERSSPAMTARHWISLVVISLLGIGSMVWLMPLSLAGSAEAGGSRRAVTSDPQLRYQ
jgi:hypothetical protein